MAVPTSSSAISTITRLWHHGTQPAGALTTVFTPPANCPSLVATNDESPVSSCMPTDYANKYWDSNAGYYSPGVCPSGYTVACSRYNSEQGPAVEDGETALICCPSAYTCNTAITSYCFGGPDPHKPTSAFGIQIRNQAPDSARLPSWPTLPVATGAGASAGTAPVIIITATPTATITASPSSHNGLGTGATVGLAIGCVVIFAAALVAGAFILARRHRFQKIPGREDVEPKAATITPENGDRALQQRQDSQVSNLVSPIDTVISGPPREMSSAREGYELSGNGTG